MLPYNENALCLIRPSPERATCTFDDIRIADAATAENLDTAVSAMGISAAMDGGLP